MAPAKREAIELWARTALDRAGYTDPELAMAVGRFQRKVELAPDGVAGIRTLMTLYSLVDYKRPRLRTGIETVELEVGGVHHVLRF